MHPTVFWAGSPNIPIDATLPQIPGTTANNQRLQELTGWLDCDFKGSFSFLIFSAFSSPSAFHVASSLPRGWNPTSKYTPHVTDTLRGSEGRSWPCIAALTALALGCCFPQNTFISACRNKSRKKSCHRPWELVISCAIAILLGVSKQVELGRGRVDTDVH